MSKWYERINRLYVEGKIDIVALEVYLSKKMITSEEYKMICGVDYQKK